MTSIGDTTNCDAHSSSVHGGFKCCSTNNWWRSGGQQKTQDPYILVCPHLVMVDEMWSVIELWLWTLTWMDISKVALLKACCGISFYGCCASDSNRLQDDWSNCGFHFHFLGSQQHLFLVTNFGHLAKYFFKILILGIFSSKLPCFVTLFDQVDRV